jgi:hypothetical protein
VAATSDLVVPGASWDRARVAEVGRRARAWLEEQA